MRSRNCRNSCEYDEQGDDPDADELAQDFRQHPHLECVHDLVDQVNGEDAEEDPNRRRAPRQSVELIENEGHRNDVQDLPEAELEGGLFNHRRVPKRRLEGIGEAGCIPLLGRHRAREANVHPARGPRHGGRWCR